jgi:hypothetical protein
MDELPESFPKIEYEDVVKYIEKLADKADEL